MPNVAADIHCVIVDDHQMLLELLAGLVGSMPGVKVVATATDVADGHRLAALGRVDLMIVDRRLRTGDGMDVVRAVAVRHPGVKCIVIAGVTADFVCPPDLLDVVVAVIDKAHACESLLAEIDRVIDVPVGVAVGREPGVELTDRERQVFAAIGEGLSNKELGSRFGISTRTVETHRKAIAKKLGVSGAALVRLAVLDRRASGRPAASQGLPPRVAAPEAGDA